MGTVVFTLPMEMNWQRPRRRPYRKQNTVDSRRECKWKYPDILQKRLSDHLWRSGEDYFLVHRNSWSELFVKCWIYSCEWRMVMTGSFGVLKKRSGYHLRSNDKNSSFWGRIHMRLSSTGKWVNKAALEETTSILKITLLNKDCKASELSKEHDLKKFRGWKKGSNSILGKKSFL